MSETRDPRLASDTEILAELLKASQWSELRVESESLSLLISEDPTTPSLGGTRVAPIPPATPTPPVAAAPGGRPAATVASKPVPANTQLNPEWGTIAAPNLGTFYRSPKPGSPPFVEVGQRVEPKTEVCLIEVMKLFTSVQAGIAGTVRHVAVNDGDLVEGGQALIYIERE